MHRDGLGVRAIADRIGRAGSTVCRELHRNTRPHDSGRYDGDLAHARVRERARRPRRSRLLADAELRAEVQAKLEQEWSPEQIAAHLRQRPRAGSRGMSATRPLPGLVQLQQERAEHAAHQTAADRPAPAQRRRRANQRKIRFVAPSVLIDHRPADAELRLRIGDWEGDLIIGRSSKSAVGTLADRASRYVRLVHLPAGHDAEAVCTGLVHVLSSLPEAARRSLTWDQGSEMALHELLAPLLADGVFFAHPGSPWQRGTNENTNGLLRQYLPKGSDLSAHSADDLRAIETRLNNRPRKTLGWRTPPQAFTVPA